MLELGNGGIWSRHMFRFDHVTPKQKRRWFDHLMYICSVWAVESERRIMDTYGSVIWAVWDDPEIFEARGLPPASPDRP